MHKLWALGCSFTLGTGVEQNQSWVSQLSTLIGMPIDNLGIEGASPLRVWHHYQQLRKNNQPQLTIIQWPGLVRHTVYRNGTAVNLGLWNVDQYPLYKQQLLRGVIEQQNRQLIARAKQLIKEPSVHFDVRSLFHPFKDLAEDGAHPGPRTHLEIAQWVYSQLTKGPAAVY